jgi:ABC-type dipeptide/oligopeptide/nickel transport system permease component
MANLQKFALPALILGLFIAALIARVTRSTMLESLGQDYVRTARAKGLPERLVIMRHAFRTTLLPLITLVAVYFVHLMTGSVILEDLFSLPGLGGGIVSGIHHRDYPTVEAMVVVVAALVMLANLGADLAYGIADPRIRLSSTRT